MTAPPAEALAPLVADVPADVFDVRFREACARLDGYVEALSLELAEALRIGDGPQPSAEELITTNGWNAAGRWSLEWLFETLEAFGHARRQAGRYVVAAPPRHPASEDLRLEAEAIVPSAAPAYAVLRLSARALPSVLRGEVRGEDVLFTPSTLSLWFDYFSNANPHYAPSNRLTALAVARALRAGARLLELGGGGGSAAEAVFQELASIGSPPVRYVFTELQPAFLRRGTRVAQAAAPPRCDLLGLRYDIDEDPAAAGLVPGSFDAILAVNTLHLARNPATTISRLGRLLAPGGVLVLGELVRPGGSGAVHLELPFTLLEGYRQVPPVDGIRTRPGFITLAGWRRAFEAAGFETTAVLPAALERCAALYAGFYCAALTARPGS
jgi:SAM-dependent methyltransferase